MKSSILSRHSQLNWFVILTVACLIGSLATPDPHPVKAISYDHIYTVDLAIDSNSAGYQVCDSNPNNCTLRGAVSKANTQSTGDFVLINIPTGTYQLTLSGVEDNNASGDLDIHGPYVELRGDGIDLTIIHGNGLDRIIDHSGTHSLKLVDLEISDGDVATGNGGGGGIRTTTTATLYLDSVRVYSNWVRGTSASDVGGGIYTPSANLSILSSTIQGNTACDGGGIMTAYTSAKSVTIDSSDIEGNSAICGDGGGFLNSNQGTVSISLSNLYWNTAARGGAYMQSAQTSSTLTGLSVYENSTRSGGSGAAGFHLLGTATITGSQFQSNDGDLGAGAIQLEANSSVTIEDSSLRENNGDDGGGIRIENNTSALIQRVEISSNIADTGGALSVRSGGHVSLENVTIHDNFAMVNGGAVYLAGNHSALFNHVTTAINYAGTHGDGLFIGNNAVWTTMSSIYTTLDGGDACYFEALYVRNNSGHNLISDSTCGLSGPTDLPNTDPELGTLGYYHSKTQVMPLHSISPAIDAALEADPLSTDQRGAPRADGDQDGIIISDIGAFEYQLPFYLPLLLKP